MAKQTFAGVSASFNRNTAGLLSEASQEATAKTKKVILLPSDELHANAAEEKVYEIRDIKALALDISKRGIKTPLTVIPDGNGEYIIISGHRRKAANDLAVKEYGYEQGEYLPCILDKGPEKGREFTTIEDLILDNLQREKTDYERMKEIVVFKECIEKRKALGEEIKSVRDVVMDRLGVSNTEITRFEKISNSMIEELMPAFKEELIASTVAYEVAKLDEPYQVYINEHWDKSKPLSINIVKALVMAKRAADTKHDEEEKKPEYDKPAYDAPATIHDGLEMLSSSLNDVSAKLEGDTKLKIKDRKRVLKKIAKQVVAMKALQDEIEALLDGDQEE